MAAGNDDEFSSPFDAMLDRDRERLERLYRGPSEDRERLAAMPAPARPATAPRLAAKAIDGREPAQPGPSRDEITGSVDGIPFSSRPGD